MGLQLILGTVGSGKTTFLYDQVIRMAGDNPATTYYFIVPEQFSIKTQYDLVTRHPDGGILNIDVTSLARLADKAFNVLHGEKPEFLPEIGKSMIIKKVLSDSKDNLKLYARNAGRAGFVEQAKALISELLQYNVSEEELYNMASDMDESPLKHKLEDAYTLYSGFTSHLGKNVHTAEGLYDAFAEVAERSGILKNSVIILDGFTGFTPSQYELLRCFMRQCEEVFISFTADETALSGIELKDFDLFRISQQSIQKVMQLADEVGCDIRENIVTSYDNPDRKKSLKALEKSLFRYNRKKTDADDSIHIYGAADSMEEVVYAASEIERLIRTGHYRYKDIGVVVSDMDVYGEPLGKELDRIKAKYFLDRKKSLGENECSALIALILKIMEKGADTDLFVSFAKSSLSGISHEEACILENYCLAFGIKGSRFKRKFEKDYEKQYGASVLKACDAEPVREKIMKTLSPLLACKESTAGALTEKIMDLFGRLNLEKKLEERALQMEESGDRLRKKEYLKVYESVMDILSQLNEYLGGEVMSVREYREVLTAGLAEARVGLVPEGSEQIVIGDIERTRLKDIKVLFLLGANDGKLPKAAAANGILSEYDKEELIKIGMELSPGMLRKVGRDRFYTYLALAKPTEQLYISYCLVGDDNTEYKPSQVLNRIVGLYNNLSILKASDLPETTRLLRNDLGRKEQLSEKRTENVKAMETAEPKIEKLSEQTAEALYGEKISGSISCLETYAKCPFRFFLNYGLRLSVRDEFMLENSDFGNVAHEALENYGRILQEQGFNWFSISDEDRSRIITECAGQAIESYNNGIFASSGKNQVVSARVAELLTITVEQLTQHLAGSDFEPFTFEHSFRVENEDFTLKGKIDRIDVCRKEGVESVKVIDYKSSAHTFDITKLYYGLSLQLPVYMQQAQKIEELKGMRPAAMLYNHILNPIVNAPDPMLEEESKEDKIRAEIAKEFKATGVVNKDFEIIKSLDHSFVDAAGTLKESVSSEKIPVGTKKGGDFTAGSKVISDEDFGLLCTMAEAKMKNQVKAIKKGSCGITPVAEGGAITGCGYCDYKSVCGFDVHNGGKARALRKYSPEDIWIKLKGTQEEQNG
ncbi:MAG: PD-(D/E)XK nuclease family protein [Lachnospiraceae bacterium]|nr:PD-(D/E)XK nuclease family protein [Lachnospiraceae bacterium]